MFPLSVCGLRNLVGIVIVCESWEDDTHPPYLSPLSRLCGRKQVAVVSTRKSGCRSLDARNGAANQHIVHYRCVGPYALKIDNQEELKKCVCVCVHVFTCTY